MERFGEKFGERFKEKFGKMFWKNLGEGLGNVSGNVLSIYYFILKAQLFTKTKQMDNICLDLWKVMDNSLDPVPIVFGF